MRLLFALALLILALLLVGFLLLVRHPLHHVRREDPGPPADSLRRRHAGHVDLE
jgi:hypothetical protein